MNRKHRSVIVMSHTFLISLHKDLQSNMVAYTVYGYTWRNHYITVYGFHVRFNKDIKYIFIFSRFIAIHFL